MRYRPQIFAAVVSATLVAGACDEATPAGTPNPSPTAPTSSPTVSVQSLRATPDSMGVLYNTDFSFEATGTFPSGVQFLWQFGDGTSTTTSAPSASHTYTQTGNFGVTVEARAGSNSSAATKQVAVRSLVGRWIGTMSGHTGFPPARPVPITGFDLTINSSPSPPGGSSTAAVLNATWSDLAGCRQNRSIVQNFNPRATAEVTFTLEAFPCNAGDFVLTGTADARFDRVEGTCGDMGRNPNCRFQMTRQ